MSKEEIHPLKVSITGIDGAGKSTVTDFLASQLGEEERVARISRPSYSVVEGEKQFHYERLLGTVDRLHSFADHTRKPKLVLGANALNVVLQGRVIEPGLINKIKPNLVLGSRDYLIDPSVYAIYYSPRLAERSMDERLSYMQQISGLDFRDVIFFLTVPPQEAVARIERRIESESQHLSGDKKREKWRHMHEQEEHLSTLQRGYEDALEVVYQRRRTPIYEIDTTASNPQQITDFIGNTIKDFLGHQEVL